MTCPQMRWPVRAVPVITMAGRAPLDRTAFDFVYCCPTHALHLHDYEGTIRMDGREFPLTSGVVTLSVARGRTSYDLPRPGHHWCVHFQPLPVRGETMLLPWHLPVGPHREFVADRLRQIAQWFERSQRDLPYAKLAAAAASVALQELLIWLGMFGASQSVGDVWRPATEAVEKLLTILNERFTEPLTAPELSKQVGLSQDRLARAFRAQVGTTIPRYLLRRRIEHARQLLITTDLPVGRIGARVGMPDPQHFNKQFRLLTGTSPSSTRRTISRKRN